MIKRSITTLSILLASFLPVSLLFPAAVGAAPTRGCNTSSSFLGIPVWYKYLEVKNTTLQTDDGAQVTVSCDVVVPKDSQGNTDITKVIGPVLLAVFEIILRISGAIAVGVVVYGGVQYILSQGEPEKTKGAKSTILNAFIGLAVVISATVVVNLIGNSLLK